MKKPPNKVDDRPTSSDQLKTSIDLVIPERAIGLIESFVIDVSKPQK